LNLGEKMDYSTVDKKKVRSFLFGKLDAIAKEFRREFAAVGVSGGRILDVYDEVTKTAQAAGRKLAVSVTAHYVAVVAEKPTNAVKMAAYRCQADQPQDPEIRRRVMSVLAPEELEKEGINRMVELVLKCSECQSERVVGAYEKDVEKVKQDGVLCGECASRHMGRIRDELKTQGIIV